jgi:hypothetical protein
VGRAFRLPALRSLGTSPTGKPVIVVDSRDVVPSMGIILLPQLADGLVIQLHDRHSVATTDGTHPAGAVIGVLMRGTQKDFLSQPAN